jgi:hypothetical protein
VPQALPWVRWWKDGDDYPRNPGWSKWHYAFPPDPYVGPLRCMPWDFKIPAAAEYQEDEPALADTCKRCQARLSHPERPVPWPAG